MKLSIPLPEDGRTHEYCLSCQAETVERLQQDGKMQFHCTTCGKTNPRSLYFDGRKAWLERGQELWHASVGIFVRNTSGKFLFFERTRFAPFGLTIPAGHIDNGETPYEAAARELKEETGIAATELRQIAVTDIRGDLCSSGADDHRWYMYRASGHDESQVTIEEEEGAHPVWLTLEDALQKDVVFATKYILEHYRGQLSK
jgi:8-oxo-dGTP pyrophosphatase MutT (NUDIX family)